MSTNPILVMTSDPGEIFPLLELKQHLVLYLETPPGPKTARVAYDLYMDRFGGHVTKYRSTAPGDIPREWTTAARREFEDLELPACRTKDDWGYRFWDGRGIDSWQFLFHGSVQRANRLSRAFSGSSSPGTSAQVPSSSSPTPSSNG